ncbi:MAG: OmpA family protein [Acidobacteria bacterium]|nr:OmpA family protein [Acidobacteriota bacterium]MCL5288500.1 OmpA family protein [Acidobacteriota bacterium]
MTKIVRWTVIAFALCLCAAPRDAQAQKAALPSPTLQAVEVKEPGGQILGFRHLSGSTEVEMRGTKLMPQAATQMKIGSRPGFSEIDINRGAIRGLEPARRFGKDFHTYVLWAVTVDGAAMNLGEITFDSTGPVSINVTTPYQTFWLMVTAEPDYAVNDPSPVVVLYSINQENTVTSNKALPVPGKLLYYTYYSQYDNSPAAIDTSTPNELLQARKAVELASRSGILAVPTPAGAALLPDEERTRQTLEQARKFLQESEAAMKDPARRSETVQFARTAAQIAENARALALGAVGGLHVRQLERDLEALRAEAESLRQQVARLTAENAALKESCEKQLSELRNRVQQLEAELARERSASSDAQAKILELNRRIGELEQALKQSAEQNARLREDREKICGELRRQLGALGSLTQQGGNLVLTLSSDILFDFGSFELRPAARENLSKLAVLRLLLFAEANVRYEGHTDRVGDDNYNQWLSEQRALAVYRYFLEDGLLHTQDAAARDILQARLVVVRSLLEAKQPPAGRAVGVRQESLAKLGDNVIGKGEREPVEDTQAASERNRRVVLLFPPSQAGQVTSLCEAPPNP